MVAAKSNNFDYYFWRISNDGELHL